MSNLQNQVIGEFYNENNCEDDCKKVCFGCYKRFCDIKEEEKLEHDKELPEATYTNAGDAYCHIDCFRDCH